MAKAKKLIIENLSLVDIVVELLDARIPLSSKNPDIDVLAKNKHRIVAMNKADLADALVTDQWKAFYKEQNIKVVAINSVTGAGLSDIITISRELMKEKVERQKSRGRIFVPIRAMVVGIPNVGKSTFINKLVGKSSAKVGDKPGVTKGKQWIKLMKDFDLLDTPGILWPKFDDEKAAQGLAFTGAINDDILDIYTLSLHLIERLMSIKPECLKNRYKVDVNFDEQPEVILEKIARARGLLKRGAEVDFDRASNMIIDEFRSQKLGNITLEQPLQQFQ